MKRAPIIAKPTSPANTTSATTSPAAPMVDSLMSRVGSMAKGNTITLPVCGRNVKFVLETIPAESVEKTTHVWAGNERVQAFLTPAALDDLIPSFMATGQLNPAFGRKDHGVIEIADGSRRRMTAILTSSEYRVLVGELDNEQMDALCKLGNDYRPTSAYERGRRYAYRLDNEFKGNISALADAEKISRKIITRCVNTAKLPQEVIALFSHPGELSARAGEQLHQVSMGRETVLLEKARELAERHAQGVVFDAIDVIKELTAAINSPKKKPNEPSSVREFFPGATAHYKGNKVIFSLDRSKLPQNLITQFEELLERLEQPKVE